MLGQSSLNSLESQTFTLNYSVSLRFEALSGLSCDEGAAERTLMTYLWNRMCIASLRFCRSSSDIRSDIQ